MTVIDALRALRSGDRRAALDAARRAPSTPLAEALVTYLGSGDGSGSVYDRPAAFTAFIRGGGNIGLYHAVADVLAGLYERLRPATLLDIGSGDGIAVAAAMSRAAVRPERVDLVEPSAMIDTAVASLADLPVDVLAHRATARDFLDTATGSWQLTQSTFAMHTMPPQERSDVLTALRQRTGALAIVEFDVAEHADRLGFLAETYERGLAEYDADRELVAQGFLVPVLVGQLAPGAVRATWEQPAVAWRDQVARCGFRDVRVTSLCDYWSSPAFLLTAS